MLLRSYTILTSLALCLISQVQAFDANHVDVHVKANFPQWCTQQIATCPLICQDEFHQGATLNICDTSTLAYECVCAGNHRPNITEYTQTIHYFTCTYDQQSCVHACRIGDAMCTTGCEQKFQCGAAHPRHSKGTPLYPPLEDGSSGQVSNSPVNRLTEQLKPVGAGGNTYLSSSNSLCNYHVPAAGLAIASVVSFTLFL